MKQNQTPPVRAIAYVALFAAIFVVLSAVTIPLGFTPVPISLQTLAILLTGAMIGGGYAFLSIGIVLVLTLLGFPLLHGAGGLSFILGPTGGFIWMFPISAFVTGRLVSRIQGNGPFSVVLMAAAMIVGSGLVYLTGVPWYAHLAGISLGKAFALVCVPFIPGDLIKVGAAVLITATVRKLNLLPRLSAQDQVVPLD
ncbi:biotin transporter BioY [Gorillibacterium timonense]|uniref:biotin transporter BioY n=1 Tax=Gorillibacterium timonense TaxID=1689269 RepID=UPI0009E87DFB|nr:biotin transporter BioY [Gorillibacterium timonense]